jgi:hypothetical protein
MSGARERLEGRTCSGGASIKPGRTSNFPGSSRPVRMLIAAMPSSNCRHPCAIRSSLDPSYISFHATGHRSNPVFIWAVHKSALSLCVIAKRPCAGRPSFAGRLTCESPAPAGGRSPKRAGCGPGGAPLHAGGAGHGGRAAAPELPAAGRAARAQAGAAPTCQHAAAGAHGGGPPSALR